MFSFFFLGIFFFFSFFSAGVMKKIFSGFR